MTARSATCPLCGVASLRASLDAAAWLPPETAVRVARRHPSWRPRDGACPACVQQALLELLLDQGEAALHHSIQRVWPLDAGAGFGALPTPLRLHADPRYTGRGVTLALVDAAFFPHPDLVRPRNRVRAWVDATRAPVAVRRFEADETPSWPGALDGSDPQWHGLMTSSAAAGNGFLSHGFYRGLASDADLVLIQVGGKGAPIGNDVIARALDWLLVFGPELDVQVVNLSLGGDPVPSLRGNPVDGAVAALVARGVTVVVAAGNDGERRLVPPATAPQALTVGGIDDKNSFDHDEVALWHSNYGETETGAPKPELVAPSLFVVAPVLPGTTLAAEAAALFGGRAGGDAVVEDRIRALRLVTPHYQHMEGTSVAAPLVASVAVTMLEANPDLTPRRVRELLVAAAHPVPGASAERQGAGAVDAGRAVTLALADRHSGAVDFAHSPILRPRGVRLLLHDHDAREVRVFGSWDGWKSPGRLMTPVEPGLWQAEITSLDPGAYAYRFLIDGRRWLTDPANPARAHGQEGAWNSVFVLERQAL